LPKGSARDGKPETYKEVIKVSNNGKYMDKNDMIFASQRPEVEHKNAEKSLFF